MDILKEVKSYLKITWDDEDDDVKELIEEAKYEINKQIGSDVDINFQEDKQAKSLLKDYCRYIRNYSKELFIRNFLQDILFLQLRYSTDQEES